MAVEGVVARLLPLRYRETSAAQGVSFELADRPEDDRGRPGAVANRRPSWPSGASRTVVDPSRASSRIVTPVWVLLVLVRASACCMDSHRHAVH